MYVVMARTQHKYINKILRDGTVGPDSMRICDWIPYVRKTDRSTDSVSTDIDNCRDNGESSVIIFV